MNRDVTGQNMKTLQNTALGQRRLLEGNDGDKQDRARADGQGCVFQEEGSECAKAWKGNKAQCIQGNEAS